VLYDKRLYTSALEIIEMPRLILLRQVKQENENVACTGLWVRCMSNQPDIETKNEQNNCYIN